MTHHTYEVRMVNLAQVEVSIYGPTHNLYAARKVAQKQNPRRKVNIYRNNKLMPGGRAGLDREAYQQCLQHMAEQD